MDAMKNITAMVLYSLAVALPLCAQERSNGPLLVLPDAKAHRLVLIGPRAKQVIGAIAVPGWPHEVDFSADGRTAYVPSYSDAIVGMPGIDGQTIDVIDMQTRTVTTTWDLGKPLRPHKPMVMTDGTMLVSTELAKSISVVDTKTGKITGEIPTGATQSHIFVVTANGRKVYTANLDAGSVSVLDVLSHKLLKIIPVSVTVKRIALSIDGKTLFVTDGSSQNVALIDTATDTIEQKIAVGGAPFAAYPSPDGRWLLVGEDNGPKGKLEVVDLKDLTVKKSYDVDRLPYGIRVVGNEAFVACYLSGNVNVLNMTTWTMETPIVGVAHGDGIALWQGVH
jgi:YVTN family beta-propeller protein